MRKLFCVATVLVVLFSGRPAHAWFDGGHMLVAYIAYKNLTMQTRSRVDKLLTLNPNYGKWTQGVARKQRGLVAFTRAATWPDCIKQPICSPGYTSDGGDVPPGNSTDAQNVGYSDTLMHKYWHFIDSPFEAGASGRPPKKPNALTEIVLLIQAIGTHESDDIKSYDLVWLEHLVGDVHQPLHCTSRFTANHPDGDAGGNLVQFCEKPCRDELHAYWDGLLGNKLSMVEVSKTGNALMTSGRPTRADSAEPHSWVQESFQIAQRKVYVAPISKDNNSYITVSPRPDSSYAAKASEVARAQVTVAGYRLAALLNAHLK